MNRSRYLSGALVVMIVIPILVAGGCATPQTQEAAPPTVDVTGVWSGIRTYGSVTTPMSLELRQAGAKVTGTASWGRPPAGSGGTGGPLEGMVSGTTLTFKVPADNSTGEVRVNGNDMQGNLAGSFSYQVSLRRQ
jgi:hypothetical protein